MKPVEQQLWWLEFAFLAFNPGVGRQFMVLPASRTVWTLPASLDCSASAGGVLALRPDRALRPSVPLTASVWQRLEQILLPPSLALFFGRLNAGRTWRELLLLTGVFALVGFALWLTTDSELTTTPEVRLMPAFFLSDPDPLLQIATR